MSADVASGNGQQVEIGWWVMGKRVVVGFDRDACVDFHLPNGQVIQVGVRADGTFGARAWPSTAIVTGNCEAVSVSGKVPSLTELMDGVRPEADHRTYPLVLDYLIEPDPPGDNAWHWASKEAQDIATEARAEVERRHGNG